MRRAVLMMLLCVGIGVAQESNRKLVPQASNTNTGQEVTIPAGTKIPLVLKQTIWTKNARENDAVYAETNFPVVVDGKIVVPPGTYVQGKVTRVQRPGKVKGKAELLVNFTSLIFSSGYTVLLPGAVDNAPSVDANIKDAEGTIGGQGSKGKDAGTVATSAGSGAIIGGLANQGKGAAIGGVAGAAVGLATVLFTRGPELKIEQGTALEMVLERPVTVDRSRIRTNN